MLCLDIVMNTVLDFKKWLLGFLKPFEKKMYINKCRDFWWLLMINQILSFEKVDKKQILLRLRITNHFNYDFIIVKVI